MNTLQVTSSTDQRKGEMEVAIAMAKKNPRMLSTFRQEAMSMATIDADIAGSCFYKLQRGGKSIEGPSIRLAEIVANAWGNIKFESYIIEESDTYVVARGVAMDLERLVVNSVEVRKNIVKADGNRYTQDMISVACNAACSLAARNAIFRTVPFAYVKTVFDQAKKVAIGNAATLSMRRQAMFDQFAKMGVPKEKIFAFVGKSSDDDIGLTELENLIGVFTSIRDGETTIDEQFGVEVETDKTFKRLRADMNKNFLKCVSIQEIEELKKGYEAEHTVAVWAKKTTHNPTETFNDILETHSGRVNDIEKSIMQKITNAKNKEAFYSHLEVYAKIPNAHTVENEEEIVKVGKALGLAEYFESQE